MSFTMYKTEQFMALNIGRFSKTYASEIRLSLHLQYEINSLILNKHPDESGPMEASRPPELHCLVEGEDQEECFVRQRDRPVTLGE